MDLLGRRFWWIAFAVSVALAAVGVTWYAASPGVASYQASTLLTLPALLFVLVWLHHGLPMRVQWIAAGLLVLVGPVGYLLIGGDQWWNWGQLTPVPLLMLLVTRSGSSDSSGAWSAGTDGPWGPP
jgi:hypothetical protein